MPETATARSSRAPARRILLAVAGLSPQVVTETLFALARQGRPAALPSEVRLLTTAEGAERARLTLLSRTPGWFHRLRREHGLPPIGFSEGHIHVLHDRRGRPLSDIRTPEENEALADQTTALVRELTRDAEAQLHVSLAGGRKTMGFYAGYALSLYGREQDRLSHVLVTPEFESHPDFFYPARRPRIIQGRDQRPLDASQAEVALAEIPFVRLRERMTAPLLDGKISFSATVAALNREAAGPRLRLRPQENWVGAGSAELRLAPREMAFYAWLARRCHEGRGGVAAPAAPDGALAAEYLAEYDRYFRRDSVTHRRLARGMDMEFFSEVKARVNAGLARAGAALRYAVQRRRHRELVNTFGLDLPGGAIEIEEEQR